MRFGTSQQLRLGQQMKLAPRMIQSMEILQLAMPALEERIEQELESNVALEVFERVAGREEARAELEERRAEESADAKPMRIDEAHGEEDFARLEKMEEAYGEAFENEYSASSRRRLEEMREGFASSRLAGERDGKQEAMANAPDRAASLTEQLLEQWALVEADDRARALGRLLIEHIDDDGYIHTALGAIAERAPGAVEPRPTEEELGRVLGLVQSFLDPAGIGARDTRECLLLQVDADVEEAPRVGENGETRASHEVVRRLIADHLDDLVHNRLPKIAQGTGLTLEEINAAIGMMRRYSVAPGRLLVSSRPPVIIPDAVVEFDEDGDRYVAYLSDGRLPNLRINREYAEMVRDRETPKETREFIRTNLTNAQWLIEALQQRRRTLQRVLNVVVEAQRDFFDQGPQALRPLPMTQVADQLGIHVATVSRAVADKHVLTPRGVYPLRRFFTGGTQTESGEEVSWEAIRAALQEVVDGEDKKKPMSDDQLVEELKKRGLEIARRTVAKYRAQLGIPSAKMRKVY